MFRLDRRTQGKSLFLFAVYDEDGAGPWVNGSHIRQEIVPIGMSRQTIELDDLGPSWRRHAENRHHVPPFDEFAAERMFRLKADKDDDVRLILNRACLR